MPGTRELRVGALLLRRHIAQDTEVLYQNFGADEAMHSHTGWNPYPTRDEAEKFVARLIASYDDPHFYSWAIECEGRVVGTIGAYDFRADENAIEVGVSVERASWGRGFATQALSAVLRYLTENERISRVTAWCASKNVGSRRALEKVGMVQIASERGALEIDGVPHDRLVFEYWADGGAPTPRPTTRPTA